MTVKPRRAQTAAGKTKTTPKAAMQAVHPISFKPPLTVTHPEMLTSGRDDEFRQVIYTIVQVLSEVESCGAAFGRAIGLTRSQFAVLMGVAYQQSDSGVRINMLARYVQLASTHVTTEVGVLSRKGLVSKTVDPEDRRSVLVRLSPKGEATVTSIAPFVRRVNDLLFKDISREQLKALREIFTVLSLNSEFALAEVRRSEREQAANLKKAV
jgi:DNA-binding MarR family transcriptional regulator